MLKLVTAPAAEPLSVAETQDYLRIDPANDQTLIASLITASRRALEEYTSRSLINTTWDYAVEARQLVGTSLRLPRAPLASITSTTYYADDGTYATFSATAYYTDTYSTPGRLVLLDGASWPSALRERVLETARTLGYGGPDPLARSLRRGRTGVIGVVYDAPLEYAFADPAAALFLGAVARGVQERGLSLLLLASPHGTQPVQTASVDGFVVYCAAEGGELLRAVLGRGGGEERRAAAG